MLIRGVVKNFGHLSLGQAMMMTMISAALRDSGGSVSESHVTHTGDGSHALVPIMMRVKSVLFTSDRGVADARGFGHAVLGTALMETMMMAVFRGRDSRGSVRHDAWAAGCPTVVAAILETMGALATEKRDRAAGMMLIMVMVKNFVMMRVTRDFTNSLRRSPGARGAVGRARLPVFRARKTEPQIATATSELGVSAAKVTRAFSACGS